MSITITAPSSSAEYTGNLSSPVLPASALHLQGALSPELDTPEIHSKFESALQKIDPTLEIRRLNSVIIELKTLFRKLFLDFGKHDREAKRLGVRSDGLDGVQPLAPQWDVLRKRFHTLIDESQTNAMDASAVLKQYVNIFTEETLQSRDCSIIKAEIDNLVLMIDDRANRARTIEGSFSDLSEDVRTFDDNIQDTLAAIHANAKVVYQELEGTRQDIRALHERLTQVTKEMTEMGIACIACLSTGALSAGAFLLKLSPEAATAAVASILGSIPLGVAAAKKWKETRKLRNQIWEREHAMAELQEKYGRARMLEESLQHSMESLTSLADKIDAISGIWHLIKTDMRQLHSELSAVVSGTVTPLFMQKLSITRGVYRNLVDTLEEYVRETAVHDGEKDHPDVFGLCDVDSDVE